MAFQPGTEKSFDGIVNYFIKFGLCLKISQSSLWCRCRGLNKVFGSCVKLLVEQIHFGPIKFMAPLSGIDKKMNLNMNIPTKERISNLDIFLYFIINFIKSQK